MSLCTGCGGTGGDCHFACERPPGETCHLCGEVHEWRPSSTQAMSDSKINPDGSVTIVIKLKPHEWQEMVVREDGGVAIRFTPRFCANCGARSDSFPASCHGGKR